MSQQVCVDNLILSFRNEFNFTNENEYLFDEDDRDDMFQMEENEAEEQSKIKSLDKLFTNLNNLTHEQLSDVLIPNIISYIYHKSKALVNVIMPLQTAGEDHNKEKKVLVRLISYIELCYKHLETVKDNSETLEQFSSFFIFTLKVGYVLFDMQHRTLYSNGEDAPMSQMSSSMSFNASSQSSGELFFKLNDILTKKLPAFLEHGLANKSIQIKLVYFYSKLANYSFGPNFLPSILKVMDKLVNKNLLAVDTTTLNEVVIRSKFNDSQQTTKLIFNRLFYSIYKVNYHTFKTLKTELKHYILKKLENKSDSTSQSNHAAFYSFIASNLKVGIFYLRILNSFVVNYHMLLDDSEAYFLVTNIFGLLSFILLHEPVVQEPAYTIIKQDLIKKIVPKLEEMLNVFINNSSYHTYLVGTNFDDFLKLKNELVNKFQNEYNENATVNHYEEIEYFGELALFHVIYLNKSNQHQQQQQQRTAQKQLKSAASNQHSNVSQQLRNAFELISMCSCTCYLPVYLISYELFRNNFENLLQLNDKTDYVFMEFYDFVLLNIYIYVLNASQFNGAQKQAINYLVNNLINK